MALSKKQVNKAVEVAEEFSGGDPITGTIVKILLVAILTALLPPLGAVVGMVMFFGSMG